MKPLEETPRCPVHDRSALSAYNKGCRCETCTTYHREYERKRWKKPEYRARRREYYRKRRKEPEYRARQREYNRKRWKKPEYRAAHRERGFRSHLKREYGITIDDYDRILEEQGGVCALCGASPNRKRLAVDHDHATGHVRGLLCTTCNTSLHSDRRPEWHERAAAYLRAPRGAPELGSVLRGGTRP